MPIFTRLGMHLLFITVDVRPVDSSGRVLDGSAANGTPRGPLPTGMKFSTQKPRKVSSRTVPADVS